jgi:hypothetical protein
VSALPATVRDQVIARELGAAVEVVRREFPSALSIVVSGSCARGDAMIDGDPPRLLSDLDLLAVVRLRDAPRAMSRFPAIAALVSGRTGTKATLAPLLAPALSRAPPTTFYHELRVQAKTIWGPDLLARIPWSDPRDIRRDDALDILLNYVADLLRLRAERSEADLAAPLTHADARRLARALLAIGDAALVLEGAFAGTLRDRAHAARGRLAATFPATRTAGGADLLERALATRDGAPAGPGPLADALAAALRLLVLAVEESARILAPGVETAQALRERRSARRDGQYRALRLLGRRDLGSLGRRMSPGVIQVLAYAEARHLAGLQKEAPTPPPYAKESTLTFLLHEWSLACPVVGFA